MINLEANSTARRQSAQRFYRLLGVFGLLALLVGVGARPAYRWFRAQRTLGMVTQGEAAAALGKWEQVGRVVKTTLSLAPAEPRVIRLAARYCSATNLAAGLGYWQTTRATLGLTFEDRLDYTRLALVLGRTDLSAQLLQELVATNRMDPRVLGLAVRHAQAVGQPASAIEAARDWVSATPGDEEAEFTLGRLLCSQPSEGDRREGRGLLWGLALRPGKLRPPAVELLVASPELNEGESRVLLKQVENQPEHLVTGYALRIRLQPPDRSPLIDAMIQAALADGTPQQLLRAAGWLAGHGEIKRVLDVLPRKVAENDPALLSARLQALLQVGELAEAVRYLELNSAKIEPFVLHCLRAAAAQKDNKPQMVVGHLQSAMAAAAKEPGKLQAVARYAEHLGQTNAAISAHQKLLNWPAATVTAGQNIIRLATGPNDTRILRETFGQLANYLPGDRGVAIRNAYLAALVNDVDSRIKADLPRLRTEAGKDFEAALAVAAVEYRLGEHPAALARIEAIPNAWIKELPSRAAVYAAILAANGQREPASRLARSIDPTTLRTEELELIKELRQ